MDMIEKVARAICEKHGFYSWEGCTVEITDAAGNLNQDDYRDIARAAIAAMREPTEAMKLAGEAVLDEYYDLQPPPDETWCAMIQAALGAAKAD